MSPVEFSMTCFSVGSLSDVPDVVHDDDPEHVAGGSRAQDSVEQLTAEGAPPVEAGLEASAAVPVRPPTVELVLGGPPVDGSFAFVPVVPRCTWVQTHTKMMAMSSRTVRVHMSSFSASPGMKGDSMNALFEKMVVEESPKRSRVHVP